MKDLIDGDMITYICGFASDTNQYHCPDGSIFKYKKEAVAHTEKMGGNKGFITKTIIHEPVENALHSVKLMLKDIMKSTDATEHQVFLSGKGNFRDDIFKDYKANRDPTHKPHHYAAIREYLINIWKADEVVGVEADDAMGWAQYKELMRTKYDLEDTETCICTLDKDLNMIPGWHYNWRADEGKGMMHCVTGEDALSYFYQQWLTGDSSDNIPGLPKVGEKTAQKILPNLGSTVRQCYESILNLYANKGFDAKHCHMIGDLIWIQRNPGQTWDQYMGLTKVRQGNE